MNKRLSRWIIVICTILLISSGCKKKTPPPPPPPPPPVKPVEAPPAKPVSRIIDFQAEPTSIQRGQSSTLRWNVTNAETITIEPGIGAVPAQGSRQVYPSDSTTYTLSARSAGGNDSRTARVTVTEPPAPPPTPPPSVREEPLSQMLERLVTDLYFDYDKYEVREDARSVLTRNADSLKQIFAKYPSANITVEGHCDERGSAEYNLGLGDRRSSSARDFLVQLGVPADKLKTISYGKERPQCTDTSEDCYQKNRRAHFTAQ
jgi:peptidoglycan-associated lipoprotein